MTRYSHSSGRKHMLLLAAVIFSLLCMGCEDDNPVSGIGSPGYADGTIYDKTDADNNGSTGKMNYRGYTYKVVRIGTQWWMAENLRTTTYNDGTAIPNVKDSQEWMSLTTEETGAWCDYDNSSAIGAVYGKLYNWYAVAAGNLAPPGWHVPSDDDWKQLEMFLGLSQAEADTYGLYRGSADNIGGKLKEAGVQHWVAPNAGATNESGFTVLPGGYRGWNGGISRALGSAGEFWTSSMHEGSGPPFVSNFPPGHPQDSRYYAWSRKLLATYVTVSRVVDVKTSGLSVRCVKN